MGTPLELVRYNNHTGKFELGETALSTLRAVRGPVGVVSVCGRARQGKSFILNQLLQQTSGGFQVAPTHRPCTKGLWMWSAPQARVSEDGGSFHLVLLDTEGIDAYDQTAQYSTQIFSLAVLLSSLFVYNQMGGIDESALDKLSLVTEMTRHIRVRAGNGQGDENDLAGFNPSFLWLLRDFYLRLEEDGRRISARDYLETALFPVAGAGPAVEAKNQIRSSIKSLFPDRDCFTLVRPMNEEQALANLDKISTTELRQEFQEGVRNLIRLIFSKALPKRIGNAIVTGPVLAGLVEAYVTAINEGAIPTIATAWQGVAESECRRASDLAEEHYAAAFNESVPSDELELDREHQRCLAEAQKTFLDVAVGEERIRRAHEKRFHAAVERRYQDQRGRRLAEAAALVNDMLYKAAVEVNSLATTCDNLEAVHEQLGSFVSMYCSQTSGPTKWLKLVDFLVATWPAVAAQVMARREAALRAEAEAAVAAEQRISADLQKQLEQATTKANGAEQRCNALQSEIARQRGELAAQAAALDQRIARAKAMEEELRAAYAVSEKQQQSAAELAEAQSRSVREEMTRQLAEQAAKLAAERQRTQQLALQVSEIESRCRSLSLQLASLDEEGGQWQARYHEVLQERLEMRRERDEARDVAASYQAELAVLNQQLSQMTQRFGELRAGSQAEQQERVSMQHRLEELEAEAAAARMAACGPYSPRSTLTDIRSPHSQRNSPSSAKLDSAGVLPHNSSALSPRRSPGAEVFVDALEVLDGEEVESPGQGASWQGEAANLAKSMEQMTIREIQNWLVSLGREEDVWRMQMSGPTPKKADWLGLARRVASGRT